jgi:Rps23 Pro-64 3,4-dihydroxylase Tpa1-like proline 4-hydroxylase
MIMHTNRDLLKHSINQKVIDTPGELASLFATAQPFRHVLIDDFFTPEMVRQLSESFPPFDERLAVNEDGIVGNKAVHEKIMHLGPAWKNLDELVQNTSFRELISSITGIPDLQYDPHYFGGGTHENRHGQCMDAHIDFNFHPVTRQHRRLNLIVYLTEDWQDEWGGSIQLHKDPYLPPAQDQVASISPRFNRCVIFETNEHSWHGFPQVNLPEDKRSISRRSFALYYYTDTRPQEETGPEHSTIYVDGHLSDDVRADTVLSARQLQHIQDLLGARDQHVKRLYELIKQHSTAYNELKDYHSEQSGVLESLRKEFQQLRQASERALAAAQSDIEQRDNDIRQREEVIHQRDLTISGLNQGLEDMENSTSWRLTRPLRRLKMFFTRNR